MLKSDIWLKYITPLEPIPSGFSQLGNPIGTIAGMVFDIYGTLIISRSGDIGSALEGERKVAGLDELLQRYLIPESPTQLLDAFFSAIETEHTLMKRNGIASPEVDVIQIWRKLLESLQLEDLHKFALEFELIINPVYPMPHLDDLLAACRRTGIKMGIISNAQFYTPILFEHFLGDDFFTLGFDPELTVLSYRIGQAKPSSLLFDIVGKNLDKKGVQRSSTLYLGNDMLNDIKPAHEAGFQTALFAGDARSLRMREGDLRCRGITADMVITDLLQLVDFI
jgi:putative hydrolase of the HAD superfamily